MTKIQNQPKIPFILGKNRFILGTIVLILGKLTKNKNCHNMMIYNGVKNYTVKNRTFLTPIHANIPKAKRL